MIIILQARFVFWKHLSALALKLVHFAVKRMIDINDQEERWIETHQGEESV